MRKLVRGQTGKIRMKRLVAIVLTTMLLFSVISTNTFVVKANTEVSGTTDDCTWIMRNGGDYTYASYYCSTASHVEQHVYDNDCDADCNECDFVRTPPLVLEYLSSGNAVVVDCLETVTTVEIPKNVTHDGKQYQVIGIEYGAFQNCSNLVSVSIPTSVTWIEACAFKNCTSLVTMDIPDSVTRIEESAFENCNKLEVVTIGDNVSNIHYSVFFDCDSLAEINVGKLNQKFASVDGVLYNKSGTKLITYPQGKEGAYTILDGVESIESYAFYDCVNLTTVKVPDGLTKICDSAFSGCTKLHTIELPESLSEIGSYAFENCKSLKEIEVPADVEYMGTGLFLGCDNLETLVIPKVHTVYELESRYMYNFGSFFGTISNIRSENGSRVPKTLKEVVITNATSIAGDAFYGCDSIESIVVNDEVVSIGQSAFCGCDNLKQITLPFVGSYASDNVTQNTHFGYIFGANSMVPESLEEVIITKETAIDEYAFYNIDTIKTLRITDDIVFIGEGAFEGCSGLKDVWYGGTKPQANEISIGECNGYLVNATWHYTHIYSNSCDPTCNVCGEERITKHDHKTTWSANKDSHWHECSVCGDKKDLAQHDYDNTCDTNCNTCGKVRSITHGYGDWQLVTPATKESEGLEIHICSVCYHEETRVIPKLSTGTWKQDSVGWWYQNADGSYPARCWKEIDNVWYYFNASGYIVTGWQSLGGTWYYFAGSGAMVTGWQSIGGTWYYFAESGAMVTGWQSIGGTWYYFAGSGAMVTGWQSIGGTWYYFTSGGAMATGWQSIGGTWYYFAGSGAMVTGWQSIGGTWYYFEGSGAMVANRWVGNYYLQADGSMATNKWIGSYYVGADGVWIP